ncbi:serine protease inhibitor Kazal-type 5-like isoform X1 [Pseudonaja textilis]|uniref:serine protease inhibitor Kazal-type 5-like isoform X1 n=1 Tax=Pseudonaja textilis TaxID=8673 RepID=UPI000EA8FF2E|nr:serine protease inhibitor Kazal-type 5-like isoform X1 [Pseudonaja textilis]
MKAIALFFTLALYIQFEDVTSQVKYQEGMCWEFQQLFINGNLYCNRDIDPIIGPNGKIHTNKCVMCRELLRKRGIAGSNGSGWSKDSSSGVDESCHEYWLYFIKGVFFCTRELNPVRDASGKQHNNKCMMCLQQFKNGGKMNSLEQRQPQYGNNEKFDNCYEYRSQIGPNGELTCTRENDPVRDDSGQTHSNKCIMCAEQFKREARQGKLFGGNGKGQPSPYSNGNTATQGDYRQGNLNERNCDQRDGMTQPNVGYNSCTGEKIPHGDYRTNTNCGGTGDSSYSVNCQKDLLRNRKKSGATTDSKLNCIIVLANLKKNKTSCQALWSPVCGTDEKTYSNTCFLCLAIVNAKYIPAIKHEGECTEVIHETIDCSKYPQTRGQVLCKLSPPEVCGTDGVTYKNECALCNQIMKTKSEIGIQNIGPCPKRKL